MNLTFLTQVGGILKPFAWIMGEILNAIYKLSSMMGLANIAFCIVLFTIVVKMLMLPLTIKQQKFTKVSAKMNPELQALQAKYKNVDRNDRNAMMKMQQEQQELYGKYGTSPFGGCLPMLILLPILFALYRVIYAVPSYVDDVQKLYDDVALAITTEYNVELPEGTEAEFDYSDAIREFNSYHGVSLRQKKDKNKVFTNKDLIDVFSVFKTADWEAFQNGELIMTKDDNGKEIPDDDYANWNAMVSTDSYKEIMSENEENIDEILQINSLFGVYNILDAPGFKFPGILLPILAALLQFLQGKISMAVNKQNDDKKKSDNPMGNSMQTMNTIMPIMSGVFCVFLPIGVGIYWVTNSGVTIIQQLVINHQLDKLDIDSIVAENEEKRTEKYQKMGIVARDNTTSSIAKSTTKSISSINTSDIRSKEPIISDETREELKTDDGKGSISSIANIMRNRNKDE